MAKLSFYHTASETALRVLRDGVTDNAWDIASGDYGKLSFDSTNENQLANVDVKIDAWADYQPLDRSTSSGASYQFRLHPSGSTAATATHIYARYVANNTLSLNNVDMQEMCVNTLGVSYAPLITARAKARDGWVYSNDSLRTVGSPVGTALRVSGGYRNALSTAGVSRSWLWRWDLDFKNTQEEVVSGYNGYFGHYERVSNPAWESGNTDLMAERFRVFWGVPCDATPLSLPVGTPASGQVVARLASDGVKIARPGFDALTANLNELLIAPGRPPIRAIAAGEVSIAGSSTVTVNLPDGVDYPDTVFVEAIIGPPGATITHPAIYTFGTYQQWGRGIRSRRVGDDFEIENLSPNTMNCRYIIFGADDRADGAQVGGDVLRKVQDAGGDYIQILDGSNHNPPRLADVLLDSRWPYVPLIAEGRWTIPQNSSGPSQSVRSLEVTIPQEDGWKPFPVWMVQFRDDAYGPARADVLIGSAAFAPDSPWNGIINDQSSYARIEAGKVTFFACPTAPSQLSANSTGFIEVYNRKQITHLRYYIFAIPT